MSLTQFIKEPGVRSALKGACARPRVALVGKMVAPPRTTRYALVGTAFDYLFRWTVERANPGCTETSTWIAEAVAEYLPSRSRLGRTARRVVQKARAREEVYVAGGSLIDDLLADSLRLARLDAVYRSGRVCVTPEELDLQDPLDVADLAALTSAIPLELFRARRRCRLNPTFGVASAMVGGADADLRIDDRLIDVKATKYLELKEEYVHQLLGYAVLERLDPGWRRWAGKPIAFVEVYFARHGALVSLPLESLVAPGALDSLGRKFAEHATTGAA
jgi:hypothetical protein